MSEKISYTRIALNASLLEKLREKYKDKEDETISDIVSRVLENTLSDVCTSPKETEASKAQIPQEEKEIEPGATDAILDSVGEATERIASIARQLEKHEEMLATLSSLVKELKEFEKKHALTSNGDIVSILEIVSAIFFRTSGMLSDDDVKKFIQKAGIIEIDRPAREALPEFLK